MKREVARLLADELESGRWKKHVGCLGAGERARCCLGVLQEIAPSELVRLELDMSMPSCDILKWSGLADNDGFSSEEAEKLAGENDSRDDWSWHIKYLRGVE